jgi:hypothetical protein
MVYARSRRVSVRALDAAIPRPPRDRQGYPSSLPQAELGSTLQQMVKTPHRSVSFSSLQTQPCDLLSRVQTRLRTGNSIPNRQI